MTVTPSPSPAPGYPLNVSATTSFADVCPGGQLSYEFWVDGNASGTLGDPQDWAFAGPSFLPDVAANARDATVYGVRVRCTSRPSCVDDATLSVVVQCPPAAAYSSSVWWTSLRFLSETSFVVNDAGAVGDIARGLLSTLRTSGTFGTESCLRNDDTLSWFDGVRPPLGDGFYYLLRGSEPTCAEPATYRTFHPAENPGDPTKRDDEITVCASP